jgi:integrase
VASIIKRTYAVKLEDGSTVRKKCEHWTIQYRDAAGKIKRVAGYKDKGATKQLAAKIELAHARGEQFMVDPHRESKATPIAEHIKEYLADRIASGCDDKYVSNAEHRLTKLFNACGWDTLADVEPNSFMRWRDKQKTADKTARGGLGIGLSAKTLNEYLDTARAFMNWCAASKRIAGVPIGSRIVSLALAGIVKAEGEKRRNRRALTDEQVATLLAVAGDRALVYRMGLATGLRRQEIDDLQWGDLRLAAIRPYAQLRAEATKARRGDRLELQQSLAEALRKMKPADVKDSARVFPEGVPSIGQWRADLAAAKIPYKDEMKRQADFHGGTRKTLCNRLHRAGVPLAAAMRRMRHTDARLTMVDYADDDGIGAEAAVLPELEAAAKPATATNTAAAGT